MNHIIKGIEEFATFRSQSKDNIKYEDIICGLSKAREITSENYSFYELLKCFQDDLTKILQVAEEMEKKVYKDEQLALGKRSKYESEDFYDTETAASILGMSESTVRNYCKVGKISSKKEHGRYKIPINELEHFSTSYRQRARAA